MNNLCYTNLNYHHLSTHPLYHPVHQIFLTPNYVQPAARAIIYTDNSYYPRSLLPTMSPMIHRPVSLSIDYDSEEETVIMEGTDEHRTYRSELYNQPIYEGNLELEAQMIRVVYREESAIIGETYDYQLHDNQPTYEENLDLEERLGRVGSRLSEETIMGHLKIVSYDDTRDEEAEICVICQSEYEKDELIGGLECGHEYHVECVKRWLKEHNSCPICKADAVSSNAY